MLGSYVYHVPSAGVNTMVVPNLLSYVSVWMLLVLAWKPLYYVARYVYALVTKNNVVAVQYGGYLHDWLVQLWGLVL